MRLSLYVNSNLFFYYPPRTHRWGRLSISIGVNISPYKIRLRIMLYAGRIVGDFSVSISVCLLLFIDFSSVITLITYIIISNNISEYYCCRYSSGSAATFSFFFLIIDPYRVSVVAYYLYYILSSRIVLLLRIIFNVMVR